MKWCEICGRNYYEDYMEKEEEGGTWWITCKCGHTIEVEE